MERRFPSLRRCTLNGSLCWLGGQGTVGPAYLGASVNQPRVKGQQVANTSMNAALFLHLCLPALVRLALEQMTESISDALSNHNS